MTEQAYRCWFSDYNATALQVLLGALQDRDVRAATKVDSETKVLATTSESKQSESKQRESN